MTIQVPSGPRHYGRTANQRSTWQRIPSIMIGANISPSDTIMCGMQLRMGTSNWNICPPPKWSPMLWQRLCPRTDTTNTLEAWVSSVSRWIGRQRFFFSFFLLGSSDSTLLSLPALEPFAPTGFFARRKVLMRLADELFFFSDSNERSSGSVVICWLSCPAD